MTTEVWKMMVLLLQLLTKNVRLANPVTLLLTPYSISVAIESEQPLPDDIPAENELLKNYARCEYKLVCDVSDFSTLICFLKKLSLKIVATFHQMLFL